MVPANFTPVALYANGQTAADGVSAVTRIPLVNDVASIEAAATASALEHGVMEGGDAPDALILHQYPNAQLAMRGKRLSVG